MNVLIHCVHCGAFCIVFLFRVIVQLSVSFQILAAPLWFCRIPIVPQTHLSHQTLLPWQPLSRQAMAVCAECQLTREKKGKERRTGPRTRTHTHTHKLISDRMGHIWSSEDVIIPPIQTENYD